MEDIQRTTNWINKILSELSRLDDKKGEEILYHCGKDCCEKNALHQGALNTRNLHKSEKSDDKLFNEFKTNYYNSENLTKRGKSLILIFEKCTCPMVANGVNDKFLCNCTVGYTKKVFETLFEKNIAISLEKSILRGDSICEQKIEIID
jgi:hypothetical protein